MYVYSLVFGLLQGYHMGDICVVLSQKKVTHVFLTPLIHVFTFVFGLL